MVRGYGSFAAAATAARVALNELAMAIEGDIGKPSRPLACVLGVATQVESEGKA
jgi:hypothetical protein